MFSKKVTLNQEGNSMSHQWRSSKETVSLALNWYSSRASPIEYCLSTTCWASVTDLAASDQTSMRLSAGAVSRVFVAFWVRHQTPPYLPSSPGVTPNIWLHFHLLYSRRNPDWCCLEVTFTVVRGEIRYLSFTEIEKYWINTTVKGKCCFHVEKDLGWSIANLKLGLCFCVKEFIFSLCNC